eukprot:gene16826-19990_t
MKSFQKVDDDSKFWTMVSYLVPETEFAETKVKCVSFGVPFQLTSSLKTRITQTKASRQDDWDHTYQEQGGLIAANKSLSEEILYLEQQFQQLADRMAEYEASGGHLAPLVEVEIELSPHLQGVETQLKQQRKLEQDRDHLLKELLLLEDDEVLDDSPISGTVVPLLQALVVEYSKRMLAENSVKETKLALWQTRTSELCVTPSELATHSSSWQEEAAMAMAPLTTWSTSQSDMKPAVLSTTHLAIVVLCTLGALGGLRPDLSYLQGPDSCGDQLVSAERDLMSLGQELQ